MEPPRGVDGDIHLSVASKKSPDKKKDLNSMRSLNARTNRDNFSLSPATSPQSNVSSRITGNDYEGEMKEAISKSDVDENCKDGVN
jgi:hypothetical protein